MDTNGEWMYESTPSFGYWVRRRRMALDMTQAELARLVGCAPVTIRKIEADERRPSRLIAERLADCLSIPAGELDVFIQTARGERSPDRMALWREPIQLSKSKRIAPKEFTQGDSESASQPFVGRQRQLDVLFDHLHAAQQGDGRAVFIAGEAGRGKTMLLMEFARQAMAADPGLVVASGNCNSFNGIGDPYLPFRDVLNQMTGDAFPGWDKRVLSREHARRLVAFTPDVLHTLTVEGPDLARIFLPGVFETGRLPVSEKAWGKLKITDRQALPPGKRDQLFLFEQFTQVFHTLSRRKVILFLLDDLHWADSASISLLFHFGMRLAGTRVLIVCAYRPSEISPVGYNEMDRASSHPFISLVNEFKRRFGEVWYDLGQADETENRRFMNFYLDTEPNHFDAEFREALFRRTQGHPLFTVEMLRDMQAHGDIRKDESGFWVVPAEIDWEALPARVEAVIRQRVENLRPDLREILSTASVEGESFTAQVIAHILKKDELFLLRQLSGELGSQYRMVDEVGEVETPEGVLTRYRFRHVLFQEYLYRRMSRGERRLLHQQIASSLEQFYGSKIGEIVVELAHHFRQAGVKYKALEHMQRAAERAEGMFAYDEAVQHLHHALELLPPREEDAIRVNILERMADDYVLLGERQRAISLYERALDLTQNNEGTSEMESVRLHRKIGETIVYMAYFDDRQRFAEKAMLHFQAGLKLVEDKPAHPETVRLLTAMVYEAWMVRVKQDWKAAEKFAQQAVSIAEQLDSPVEKSQALDALASVYGGQGLFRERLAVSLRRLELSRDPGFRDLRQQANIFQQTGFAYSQVGEYRKALPYLIEAEELSNQVQALDQLYRSIRYQAICYFRLDEWDKVIEVETKRQDLEKHNPNFSELSGST